MHRGSSRRAVILAGCWSGRLEAPARSGPGRDVLWALTIVPRPKSSAAPNVFGGCPGGGILRGSWDAATNCVELCELDVLHPQSPVATYSGHLVIGTDGSAALTGSWRAAGQDDEAPPGAFACHLEARPQDEGGVVAGLFIGHLVPEGELAEFIPTNPLVWSLALLPPSGEAAAAAAAASHGCPRVFGGGFYSDAGDVEGHPTLFFSLEGEGLACFTKTYEQLGGATAGRVVYSDCSLSRGGDDCAGRDVWLRGRWSNAAAGTEGRFEARLHPAGTPVAAALVLCARCCGPVWPGEPRWTCGRKHCTAPAAVLTQQPWAVCFREGCLASAEVQEHRRACAPLAPAAGLVESVAAGATCSALVLDALQRFADRPLLGVRRGSPQEGAAGSPFVFRSYAAVGADVAACALALRAAGVAPGSFAVLVADTTPELVVATLACVVAGVVLVPVAVSLGAPALVHILTQTRPAAVFVDLRATASVAAALASAQIEPLLSCCLPGRKGRRELQPDAGAAAALSTEEWRSWDQVATAGAAPDGYLYDSQAASGDVLQPSPLDPFALAAFARRSASKNGSAAPDVPPADDPLVAVLFTSGSTGAAPKGAVFTESLALPTEGVAGIQPFVRFDFQAHDPAFVLSLLSTLQCGGSRALSVDIDHVLDDLQAARPTNIGATPAFWNMLHAVFRERASSDSSGASVKARENRAAAHVRSLLGGRLVAATSGGAPLSAAVRDFFVHRLGVDLRSLYGSREAGGIAADGVVYPGVDVRLLPRPDLGLDGVKAGELAVHSPRLVSGYFREPELTATTFVQLDGKTYFRTGDVAEIVRQPDGATSVKLRDRCGVLVKLAQGEWISPSTIEAVLESCPSIEQIFIMARSDRPFPVAVVVPSVAVRMQLQSAGASEAQACTRLLNDVRLWAAHHHLRPMEVPQAVRIAWEPWTADAGLGSAEDTGDASTVAAAPMLTSTLKKNRPVLAQRYAAASDELYAEIDTRSTTCSASDGSSECTHEARGISAALAALLPPGLVADPQLTFAECGGDSLASVMFAAALTRAGVRITTAALHDYSLGHLDAMLAAAASGAVLPAAVAPAREIDWEAEMTLPADWPPRQPSSAAATGTAGAASATGTAALGLGGLFITGATGFLGPLLVAEALASLPPPAPVLCLVRGATQADAAARLAAAAARAGVPVPGHECSDTAAAAAWVSRVRVFAGDVSAPRFGLSDADWATAVGAVSAVVHSGATVDMLQPYSRLRAANVGGALTAAALALEARAPLTFVSSIGALPPRRAAAAATDSSSMIDRGDGWVRLDPLLMSQKSGYGQTKAVAEALLFAAAARSGLDLRVVRPSAVSGHRTSGYANTRDATCMLLAAMVALGAAPAASGLPLRWIPVDFVAAATLWVALAPAATAAGRAFNLITASPPLSVAVAALREAGYGLQEVPAGDWPATLARLPPTHCAAPLIAAFSRMDVGQDDVLAARQHMSSDSGRARGAIFGHTDAELQLPTAAARSTLQALGLPWPDPVGVAEAVRAVRWLAADGFLPPPVTAPLAPATPLAQAFAVTRTSS